MWERVEIHGLKSTETPSGIEFSNTGLDATAEEMHQIFLTDLPHLNDAILEHQEILTETSAVVSKSMESARLFGSSSAEIEEIDRDTVQQGFDLDLRQVDFEGLTVSTMLENGVNLVRIIAPERFGGLIQIYKLPQGVSVEKAIIDNGILQLKFL
tara:strand:- start:642 stop:1106 length:465 start_codon:yes stop_codon:yes gene_type:complete